jgi:hypothetical protein
LEKTISVMDYHCYDLADHKCVYAYIAGVKPIDKAAFFVYNYRPGLVT